MLLCTLHSASCIHVLCVSNADVNAILIHFDIGVEDLLSDTGILYAFLHSLQWFANHHPLAESTAFVRLRTTFFCIGRPDGYVAGGHSLLLLLDRVYLWLFVDRTADATRYIILRIRIQFLGSFSAIALCRQSTDSFFFCIRPTSAWPAIKRGQTDICRMNSIRTLQMNARRSQRQTPSDGDHRIAADQMLVDPKAFVLALPDRVCIVCSTTSSGACANKCFVCADAVCVHDDCRQRTNNKHASVHTPKLIKRRENYICGFRITSRLFCWCASATWPHPLAFGVQRRTDDRRENDMRNSSWCVRCMKWFCVFVWNACVLCMQSIVLRVHCAVCIANHEIFNVIFGTKQTPSSMSMSCKLINSLQVMSDKNVVHIKRRKWSNE